MLENDKNDKNDKLTKMTNFFFKKKINSPKKNFTKKCIKNYQKLNKS